MLSSCPAAADELWNESVTRTETFGSARRSPAAAMKLSIASMFTWFSPLSFVRQTVKQKTIFE